MSVTGDHFDEAVAEAYGEGVKKGRELERAAVVKWLREALWSTQYTVNLSHDIERSKHLEER